MPHCFSCSAPLPAYSGRCEYCGANNDMNLQGIAGFRIDGEHGERTCPVCRIALDTVTIETLDGLQIERCGRCMGLFFDPEELNVVLEKTVTDVYSVNLQRIWNMNQASGVSVDRPAYVKCPACGDLMNRVNFGTRSGVVIDRCRHGVWLDNGALRRLLEWRKAGGELLHEQVLHEKALREKEIERRKKAEMSGTAQIFSSHERYSSADRSEMDLGPLITAAAKIIWKLFV